MPRAWASRRGTCSSSHLWSSQVRTKRTRQEQPRRSNKELWSRRRLVRYLEHKNKWKRWNIAAIQVKSPVSNSQILALCLVRKCLTALKSLTPCTKKSVLVMRPASPWEIPMFSRNSRQRNQQLTSRWSAQRAAKTFSRSSSFRT